MVAHILHARVMAAVHVQLASTAEAAETEVNVILCEPSNGPGPANISRTKQCPPGRCNRGCEKGSVTDGVGGMV